jgi:salicylate hydroxylase
MSATMRVAVVGGGMGGLATALAFHRLGIEVQCFEQAGALSEVGAGVVLAPNGVRPLRHLGVGEAVERFGARITNMVTSLADGTELPKGPPPPTGGPPDLFGMHRADLVELLLAGLPPDTVMLGHQCIGFDQDADGATVRFANGTSVDVDVVIAADGIHSSLQQHVVPPAKPVYSGSRAYRGTLTRAEIDWPPGRFQLWMGPGRHFLVYPLRADELVNYVGFVDTAEEAKESWSAPGDPRSLAAAFSGFDETVVRLIDRIEDTFTWGLYDREPLERWSNGRLALLGDAAHPMLPHAGQGANQAFEDAVTVAALVARGDSATVPRALEAYAELRRPRTARIQSGSRSNGSRYDGKSSEEDRPVGSSTDDLAWLHGQDAVATVEEYARTLSW